MKQNYIGFDLQEKKGHNGKIMKKKSDISKQTQIIRIPTALFLGFLVVSILLGTIGCQATNFPAEKTPVSSTTPDYLVVDKTPTNVEIEIPIQTVTPELSETIEVEETTQTPEVIVTEKVTRTPTEVITPVPTEEFRRDFTEEEAEGIMEEMFESENLKIIRELREKEMVNKVYITDFDNLYFSQIAQHPERPGIIKEYSLSIQEQSLFIKSQEFTRCCDWQLHL